MLLFVMAFLMVFGISGVLQAEWIPDDDGKLYWWEAPPAADKVVYQKKRSTRSTPSQTNAEVLFIMDTSGSMWDETEVLCSKINDIVTGLQNQNINIEYKILGITENYACTTDYVYSIVTNPTVNHYEDWGPAVEDVANQYSWKSGYARIAIPISDEGAENGNSWNSYDDDAIDRAKLAAKANTVGVIPIVCSGYYQDILDGATELANYCWGSVFISTDSSSDLISGIIAAINQIFNPVSENLEAQVFVDDAFASVTSSIKKIAGDIAFIVVQLLNGSEQQVNTAIEISYPSNWTMVDHNAIMRREKLVSEEESLTETTLLSSGKVTIQNIQVPIDLASTVNENEGKSFQYIVKLIIPKNEPVGIYPISASISSSLLPDASFTINIVNKGKMILTNRNLLIRQHADKDDVASILKEIFNISQTENAIVFYADWWDEYDNFAQLNSSSINPEGTGEDNYLNTGSSKSNYSNPIKWWGWDPQTQSWDRDVDIDYSSENSANEICLFIDKYVHYWAEQLGGLDKENYLLIVGGDSIIPFYRTPGMPDDWFDKYLSHYNASQYTRRSAENHFGYSDIIYADTDYQGYRNGKVETIYPGRIVGQNSKYLLSSLQKVSEKRTEQDNTLITCLINDLKIFTDNASQAITDATLANYNINVNTNTDLYESEWTFSDLKREFSTPFDHFIFRGHGATTEAWQRFQGVSFDEKITINNYDFPISQYFDTYKPNFMPFGCLMGQVDRDSEASANSALMIYSLVRNNVRDILAATTVSAGIELLPYYFGSIIGKPLIGKIGNIPQKWEPKTLGQALAVARNNNLHPCCAPVYQLYGTPWHKYLPPKERTRRGKTQDETNVNYTIKSIKNRRTRSKEYTVVKTIQENIQSYNIVSEDNFEFIQIEGFKRFHKGEDAPALPVKKILLTLPNNSEFIGITVTKSNMIPINNINIPVMSNAPPMPDPNYSFYVEASDNIGMYATHSSSYTYSEQNNQTVVMEILPVAYDTVNDSAYLYKDLTIDVYYKTTYNGVMLSSYPDQQNYVSDATITSTVIIENIVDEAKTFTATVNLRDLFNNLIRTGTTSVRVDSGAYTQATISIQSPSAGGSYWVETNVNDGAHDIGYSVQQINVNPGAITNIEIPRCSPGSTAEFTVTFVNDSSSEIETSIGLLLYEGVNLQAEFLPKVYTINPNSNVIASFSWAIPSDFPGGNYLAIATAKTGEYVTSSSETFSIGSLNEGWNLFSLSQVPNDTSITAVLDEISGQYYSVWAYENGIWSAYFPDIPGLSDLTTLTEGKGYWINMRNASNFTSPGTTPGKTISLTSGWNLVGFNSTTSQSVADALSSIAGKYQNVWTYEESAWKLYDPVSPGFSDLFTLEPGRGYWIKANEACTWTLP